MNCVVYSGLYSELCSTFRSGLYYELYSGLCSTFHNRYDFA